MGVDSGDQRESPLVEQLHVIPHLRFHWIDQDAFAGCAISYRVGVAKGGMVEKLSQKHPVFSSVLHLAGVGESQLRSCLKPEHGQQRGSLSTCAGSH